MQFDFNNQLRFNQSEDPYILLWLEAPLQSWGYNSKFGIRDTLKFPTKSGVLGLIFSALGYGGEQKEALAEFSDLDMQVISYSKTKNGVINDKNPLLMDFHMIGAGYDEKDKWQRLLIPKTSTGTKTQGGGEGVRLTNRFYLQDAVFAVALQIPKDRAEEICNALKNPHWSVFLGRKNCIPTEFIFQGIFSNTNDLFEKSKKLQTEKELVIDFFVFQGGFEDSDERLFLNDNPVSFGEYKKYTKREISIFSFS